MRIDGPKNVQCLTHLKWDKRISSLKIIKTDQDENIKSLENGLYYITNGPWISEIDGSKNTPLPFSNKEQAEKACNLAVEGNLAKRSDIMGCGIDGEKIDKEFDIPENNRIYSSVKNFIDKGIGNASSRINDGEGWIPEISNKNQGILLDMINIVNLNKIKILGNKNDDTKKVTQFKIKYYKNLPNLNNDINVKIKTKTDDGVKYLNYNDDDTTSIGNSGKVWTISPNPSDTDYIIKTNSGKQLFLGQDWDELIIASDGLFGITPYFNPTPIDSQDDIKEETKVYDNGEIYTGTFKNGKKHGKVN